MESKMKYEIIIPRQGVAKCEADWEDHPMCKEVPLIRDKVLNSTKQRALASPRLFPPDIPTQLEEQLSSSSEMIMLAPKTQHIAKHSYSTEDYTEKQRRRRQRKLMSRAQILTSPRTPPPNGTGLAKR